ncbi:hypothetical protein [Polyangium aurulentum]|uniref:hypothetical protein n=1 Tax=Polyangium aurulentum TaxID=2567896 RepID=UPI0010AE3BA1|nr:hypothetical protein [Polyangium aurulentum]UQA60070.1 hypothetical protein E8A73_006170 [Polyangium aurulentum]
MLRWKTTFVAVISLGTLVFVSSCSNDGGGVTDGGHGCPGSCASSAPEGWDGPAALWRGEIRDQPDGPCPAEGWGFTQVAYPAKLEAPPHICQECACEPSEGACAAREVVEADIRAPDFGPVIVVCSAESKAGCPSGQGCGPRPPAGYGLCVMKSGDVPCVGDWARGERFTFYRSFEDSRDCTACACEAPKPDASAKRAGKRVSKTCGAPSGGQAVGAFEMRALTTACCR